MTFWRAPFALTLLVACSDTDPLPVFLHAEGPDPGTELALVDFAVDLTRMGHPGVTRMSNAPACTSGEIHVHVRNDSETQLSGSPQRFRVEEEKCEDGRILRLDGGSRLSRQWAIYSVLEQLGVRYFHPEQTLYPRELVWPDAMGREQGPYYLDRDIHVHRTHPVELSPPLDPGGLDMATYQRRWIDWNVKIRATKLDGYDSELVGAYAYDRGFPRTAGFNLLNSQQGGRPVLDPDDPRSEEEQMTAAVEEEMAPREGLPDPSEFGFQFNPSEFTEADDQDTVRRLTFLANLFAERYPSVPLYAINHGTHQEPTEHYGTRFFDLIQFAPQTLGARVHTLMFYDLERAAPVYGNESFRHTLEWIRAQSRLRRVRHYPEASWWLTFDLPVPLYLATVTLDARQRDLDLLDELVATDPTQLSGVHGHDLFSSGQEWGYWLIDYCVAQMTWDRAVTAAACLEDFTSSFARGSELRAILDKLTAAQVSDLRDPEILRYLVGTDRETEVALSAGIVFHPLPPSPADVLELPEDRLQVLTTKSLPRLQQIGRDGASLSEELDEILAAEAPDRAPWVREIADGVRVYGLRAEHAFEVYSTAVALRAAVRSSDLEAIGRAYEGVVRARAVTERATEVVWRRERDYRYPKDLTIAGDETGSPGAVPNLTIYPYRYLGRTHRMFYWHRPDEQLAALFGEGIEQVSLNRRVLRVDTPLLISTLIQGVQQLSVDYGDGTRTATLAPHSYSTQGRYSIQLDARHSGGALHHEDEVAVVERRFFFKKGSLKVQYPEGAAAIEGLLSGYAVGFQSAPLEKWIMAPVEAGEVEVPRSILERDRDGLLSPEADFEFPLTGIGKIEVYGAALEIVEGSDPRLRVSGTLRTQDVIDLLVSVGGFEPEGARTLIARILDFTPGSLPESVPFLVEAKGKEAP